MRQSINLVSAKQSLPSWLVMIDQYSGIINTISIGCIVLASLLTSLGLVWSSRQIDAATNEKNQQIASLKQYESKEAKYFMLKNRLQSIDKILKSQDPFTSHLDTAMEIAVPPQLASFSLTDIRQVQIQIAVGSTTEGQMILDKITALVTAKRISHPTLSSVSMDGNGSLKLGVVYTVIK